MVHAGYEKPDLAGLRPEDQLREIEKKTHAMVELQYVTYNQSLLPALRQNGLRVVAKHEELTGAERKFADHFFQENVYPVLTPMAVDSSRPFPLVYNKSLNIAALVREKDKDNQIDFAMVQVSGVLPRVVEIPAMGERVVILLEEIIKRNMASLFIRHEILAVHSFRIMRNADLSIDEDEAGDLLKEKRNN